MDAFSGKRGAARRVALDPQQMRQLWATWRSDPWLQSVRTALHRGCCGDIGVTVHKCSDQSNIDEEEIVQGATDLLLRNVASIIDWICVAGVCPIGVGSGYLLGMGDEGRVLGVSGGVLAFVPAYENVQIHRVSRRRMPTTYDATWNDEPENINNKRDHASKKTKTERRTSVAEESGADNEDEGGGDYENQEEGGEGELYDLCTFVPNHTAERTDAAPCSVLTGAFRTLQEMALLEATFVKSNLIRTTVHLVAENQQDLRGNHGDASDWMVPGVSNEIAKTLDLEGKTLNNESLMHQHTAMRAMQDNAHGVYEVAHPFDRHMRVMPGGQKMTQIQQPAGMTNVGDTREHLLHQLCKCFGVPPSSIGMTKPESQSAGSGSRGHQGDAIALENTMWEQTKDAWCEVFSDWITFVVGRLMQAVVQPLGGEDWLASLARLSPSVDICVFCRRPECTPTIASDPAKVLLARALCAISEEEEANLLRSCVGLANVSADQASTLDADDEKKVNENAGGGGQIALRDRVLQSAYAIAEDKINAAGQ